MSIRQTQSPTVHDEFDPGQVDELNSSDERFQNKYLTQTASSIPPGYRHKKMIHQERFNAGDKRKFFRKFGSAPWETNAHNDDGQYIEMTNIPGGKLVTNLNPVQPEWQ